MGIRWQNISELTHAFSLVLSFCSFHKALEQSQLAPDKAEQAPPGKETHILLFIRGSHSLGIGLFLLSLIEKW